MIRRSTSMTTVFCLTPQTIMASAGGTLLRPDEALDAGALVLLGEPGAGKTTTFTSLTGAGLATSIRGTDDAARRRLSGVFLVAAPDEDTASIPVHLRETAAWLLAYAPEEYCWLASADPDGLIAHSSYITDSGTRAVMVEGLLRRAAEVELAERSWRRTRWRLAHPGLVLQG